MMMFKRLFSTLAGCAAAFSVAHSAPAAHAEGLASPWFEGFNNKARLLGGNVRRPLAKDDVLFGAIEIAMPAGWKTYWRAPGDAGGIPPEFDFTASENAEKVIVHFPAPRRYSDKTGTTVGYKDQVIFPVELFVKDPEKPVLLRLKAAYGVCKELCVPAEAELELTIPPNAGFSEPLQQAVSRVPRLSPAIATDPVLSSWRVETRDGKPILVLDVTDPGGPGGDAFADTPAGHYLPVSKKVAEDGSRATYELDLSDGVDLKELKGKPVTITLVGPKGQSQNSIDLP